MIYCSFICLCKFLTLTVKYFLALLDTYASRRCRALIMFYILVFLFDVVIWHNLVFLLLTYVLYIVVKMITQFLLLYSNFDIFTFYAGSLSSVLLFVWLWFSLIAIALSVYFWSLSLTVSLASFDAFCCYVHTFW